MPLFLVDVEEMSVSGRSLEVESDVEDEELERVVQEKTESQQREADGDLVEKRRDVDRGTDHFLDDLLADKRHEKEGEENDDHEEGIDGQHNKQTKEIVIVLFPNARVQPLAVMVKIRNTLVTGTAVLRGRLHTFPADKAVVALLDIRVFKVVCRINGRRYHDQGDDGKFEERRHHRKKNVVWSWNDHSDKSDACSNDNNKENP